MKILRALDRSASAETVISPGAGRLAFSSCKAGGWSTALAGVGTRGRRSGVVPGSALAGTALLGTGLVGTGGTALVGTGLVATGGTALAGTALFGRLWSARVLTRGYLPTHVVLTTSSCGGV